jgi:tRNA-dihydrouridine synthase
MRVAEAGCDGVMMGRAIFGNFWLFNPTVSTEEISLSERLRVLSDLAERFEVRYGGFRSISVLRKHVKGLVNGFNGASELREELMACTTATAFRVVANKMPS